MPGYSLLLLAAWFAAAEPVAVLARYEAARRDHSPASTAILADEAFLSELRRLDPLKAASLVRDKALLRDLETLVWDYASAWSVRSGLRIRSDPTFDDAMRSTGLGPASFESTPGRFRVPLRRDSEGLLKPQGSSATGICRMKGSLSPRSTTTW